MKRLLWVVLLLVVPGILFATDAGIAATTVTISFFSIGLGLVGVSQKTPGGWIVGGFQIALGVLGIVLLVTGNIGDTKLLETIKEQTK